MTKSSQPETSFVPYAAPDFALPSSDGTVVSLTDLRGQWVVLFLYPADNTPTCTQEACDFSASAAAFAELGVRLFGLSKDSLKSHDKFIQKCDLKMPLLADETTQVIDAFGAWGEKMLYGRKYLGTERSTFVIDPQGQVRQAWRSVKIKNHVDEVLSAVRRLTSPAG